LWAVKTALLVGDVRGDRLDFVTGLAQMRHGTLQLLRTPRRQRQAIALLRQHRGDRQSDPA
jgi:hypothetical protein